MNSKNYVLVIDNVIVLCGSKTQAKKELKKALAAGANAFVGLSYRPVGTIWGQ